MKKYLMFLLMAACSSMSFAQAISPKDVPKTPPPYGAYYIDLLKMSTEEKEAVKNAVAKHYGYSNWKLALEACWAAKSEGCSGDFVRHKRANDEFAKSELQKYGFKTWKEAELNCGVVRQMGDVNHCQFDPFLRKRLKEPR